ARKLVSTYIAPFSLDNVAGGFAHMHCVEVTNRPEIYRALSHLGLEFPTVRQSDQIKPPGPRPQTDEDLSDDQLMKLCANHDDRRKINFDEHLATLRTIIVKIGRTHPKTTSALTNLTRLLACAYHPEPIRMRIIERARDLSDRIDSLVWRDADRDEVRAAL